MIYLLFINTKANYHLQLNPNDECHNMDFQHYQSQKQMKMSESYQVNFRKSFKEIRIFILNMTVKISL